jgi:hypothetical protein
MSHFNVVATTGDYMYGQPDAADLAIEKPIPTSISAKTRRRCPGDYLPTWANMTDAGSIGVTWAMLFRSLT